MRELITSPRLPAPRFRYTPCVKSGPAGFVSGMVALDPETGALVQGGVGEQTRRILDSLLLALPDYGFSLDELCLARIYTTQMERFAEINAAWEIIFASAPPPARTSVGVVALPLGAAVEMEFFFMKELD
jgi:2-iminobutanoate/2-iminopropanoate deaminase